uniref:RNA-directed DNA polymerase, eukaryota, reverse transcriptase zinc-binding domain protein n=1 Tax=Tanacetum cinerariifolium TaxID=118510 RepID=A0A6L2P1X9_TANCI|nr:RNA-directed DNA polymerase, eukaryota, reverse transcriptase zinc-binding domain protein [Tanacetum cinerariifolium]
MVVRSERIDDVIMVDTRDDSDVAGFWFVERVEKEIGDDEDERGIFNSLHNIDGVKRGNSGDTYNSNGVKGAANSYAHVVKGSQNSKMDLDSSPVMVLDDSCLNEKYYSLCLMGKVKDFATLANLKVVVANEGFDNIKFKYMGRVFWVRSKEVPGWIPDFVKDNDEEDDSEAEEDSVGQGNVQSEDPFNIYELLNHKRPVFDKNSNSKESLRYPLGYTPTGSHFKKSGVPKSGGSILQLIDDLVKVGETMGYDMKGCMKNMEEIIELQGANDREVVIMGDFNEVRNKSKRFGMLFNRHATDVFNRFISNAGLEEVDGFDKFIENSWKDAPVIESNSLVRMMKKLKYLKEKIRMWNKLNKEKSHISKRSLLAELADCDAIIDKGEGENNVVNRRTEVVKLLQEVEKKNYLEAAQKAKIKWAIEGDENSKYYHGVINKKRNQLTIRGILMEDTWIDSPSLVKSEFLSHFKNRLYGIDKSPGPDGFTFGFYRRYWKLIENDVVDAVTCFFHQGSFPKGGNSSFIILIPKTPNANMVKYYRPISLIESIYKIISKILENRLVVVLGGLVNEIQSTFVADKQILDGPFILNELVQWCKKKKNQSLVFKVDFEKAHDSVRWDHLDDIMRKFGFGEKWLDVGLFKCIELAHSLNLSHMFYADDAIFMGQWSESNIDAIVKVLDCFNRASGLRINMTKSKLLGISVEDDKSWNETIERMACRLSKWKLKTLSIGGRLTLLKSVLGSMPIYHMSLFKVPKKVLHRMESMRSYFFNGAELSSKKSVWVKWKHYLASKDKRGLGVSSLFALNRALMFKWKVKSCYPLLWLDIIHEVEIFKSCGIDLVSLIHSKLGNGANTPFWEVAWRGGSPFKSLFPRGGVELQQFEHMKEKVEECILADMMDR